MITRLQISSFRAFQELSVSNLKPVNLFVGTNNSGKTSLLDAVELLLSRFSKGQNDPLLRSMERRNEFPTIESVDSFRQSVYDTSVFFHGRNPTVGTNFKILGTEASTEYSVVGRISKSSQFPPWSESGPGLDSGEGWQLVIEKQHPNAPSVVSHPITEPQGILVISHDLFVKISSAPVEDNIQYLSPDFLSEKKLSQYWDAIQLRPEQEEVEKSLQIVAPEIEKVAFLSSTSPHREKGLARAKIKGHPKPVFLGSLGSGTRRMLALSLALSNSIDGALMCDEIDTGFHYSALPEMWSLVIRTAIRLNCQVFATTHSRDCIEALGKALLENEELADQVSLHRLEKGEFTTISYTGREVSFASQHYVEVR